MQSPGWLTVAALALSLGTGAAQNPGVVDRGESHEGMGFSQTTRRTTFT
jgi:hypothetical protein